MAMADRAFVEEEYNQALALYTQVSRVIFHSG
jgi:hypothetical protein